MTRPSLCTRCSLDSGPGVRLVDVLGLEDVLGELSPHLVCESEITPDAGRQGRHPAGAFHLLGARLRPRRQLVTDVHRQVAELALLV